MLSASRLFIAGSWLCIMASYCSGASKTNPSQDSLSLNELRQLAENEQQLPATVKNYPVIMLTVTLSFCAVFISIIFKIAKRFINRPQS
jgi:hypothetical protein